MLTLTILFVLVPSFKWAMGEPPLPRPNENLSVFDYAGLVDAEDEQHIMSIAQAIDKKTKAQIVVVTVNDLSGLSLEDYSLRIFRDWGIGDKEKNNGVLILVNKDSVLRNQSGRIRIEVGYGLEGAINDGKAGAILDEYALPAFEEKQYSKGITDTFLAVSTEIAREYDLDLNDLGLSELDEYGVEENDDNGFETILAVIVFIILIIITMFFPPRRRRRYYKRGPFNNPFGPFGGGGGFGGPSSGGFGGFSGGSSFGGGRSFGGGSSGGGGASR